MMEKQTVQSDKPNENRAAANSIFQNKRNPKGAMGLADKLSGTAAGRLASIPNGPEDSSKFIRLLTFLVFYYILYYSTYSTVKDL